MRIVDGVTFARICFGLVSLQRRLSRFLQTAPVVPRFDVHVVDSRVKAEGQLGRASLPALPWSCFWRTMPFHLEAISASLVRAAAVTATFYTTVSLFQLVPFDLGRRVGAWLRDSLALEDAVRVLGETTVDLLLRCPFSTQLIRVGESFFIRYVKLCEYVDSLPE